MTEKMTQNKIYQLNIKGRENNFPYEGQGHDNYGEKKEKII